jgi:exoribonuclease R
LGDIGDLNVETEALLLENNLVYEKFSQSALQELPNHSKERPYQIPQEEFKKRKDLRNLLTMSIDPIGCVDIDDTLSFKQLNNGNVQIGVHIADVTAFVKLNSQLDLEARNKSTTIYLIDRRLDMLPDMLSSDLCSLHMKHDRYAVSVIWEFSPDGIVKNQWFGRTIINSNYSLHYDQAQNLIDGLETEPVDVFSI